MAVMYLRKFKIRHKQKKHNCVGIVCKEPRYVREHWLARQNTSDGKYTPTEINRIQKHITQPKTNINVVNRILL